tara:strand:+ start:156 stop:278 length:123 start_codon:yes stop_codon:yes gene_type:complete
MIETVHKFFDEINKSWRKNILGEKPKRKYKKRLKKSRKKK